MNPFQKDSFFLQTLPNPRTTRTLQPSLIDLFAPLEL